MGTWVVGTKQKFIRCAEREGKKGGEIWVDGGAEGEANQGLYTSAVDAGRLRKESESKYSP